jgi:flagellar hook-basal body complex protein FliE
MQAASITNAVVNAMAQMTGSDSVAQQASVPADGQTPFSGLLKNAIAGVQSLEDQAANQVQGLVTGQGVDVHQAMIATEKADMSFEMALAVRSKAVAAYQQVMQMQF